MKVAVIGSGVAGLSTIQALVARNIVPTVMDVGESLPQDHSAIVEKLKHLPRSEWSVEDYNIIRQNPTMERNLIPKKVHFGSDYIYAKDRFFARIESLVSGRAPFPTFSFGGFSNIWGGAVLPVRPCDMSDWPITPFALEPFFKKVADILPITGGKGTLNEAFPLFKDQAGILDPGPQGQLLLEDLDRVKNQLRDRQILFGRSRLAVYTSPTGLQGVFPCNGCGECFVGCVYGSIFSTIPIIESLVRQNKIQYQRNLVVRSVHEEEGKATLKILDLTSGTFQTSSFDAVFVAAGPINSTRILLQSRNLYNRPILLKESQKFVIPILRKKGAPTAVEHPSATLASVFMEFKVSDLSDHWIHMQIVPMNQMILASLNLPGSKANLGEALWRPVLRRTMVGWVGLHSDHSSHVELRLRRGLESGTDILELDFTVSDQAKQSVKKTSDHLFRSGLTFNTLFLPWLTRLSNPGSGTHCGGSFPMMKTPSGDFDTDILGRPFGWKRVFVTDSSVLPSIPGTTLAISVMANAYRIVTEAPL